MQPDREDAERDDAAVEVAAHLFFCEPFARLAAPRALSVAAFRAACCSASLSVAAVVKSRLGVQWHLTQKLIASNARER